MSVASDWVTAGASWRAYLTPIGAESTPSQANQPRIFDFAGMTPASAARAYNRVLAQRQLEAQALHSDTTDLRFVNDNVPRQPGVHADQAPSTDKKVPEQPGVTTPPTDTKAPEPQGATPSRGQPGVVPPHNPAASTPATTPAPSTTSPAQTSPAPQPGEIPKTAAPIPAPPPGSEPSHPLFDRPDTSKRQEGDTWNVKRDGYTIKYSIPSGNGNKTVDQEVYLDGVLIGKSRVAYGEYGGARQWVDIVGSASLYAEQESAGSNQITQVFNAGTATTGTPDSVFGTLPDLQTTFPLVDHGVRVGYLETISAEPGLYRTAYTNNNGETSTWRTNDTGLGELITNPIRYINHAGHGWHGGNFSGGPLWTISPKLDGSPFYTNIEITNNGTHIRTFDPEREVQTDKYLGNFGVGGYLSVIGADGATISGDDGSRAQYDRFGKLIESRGPTAVAPRPDLRSNFERFTSFSRDVATGFEYAFKEMRTGLASLVGQQHRDDVDGWASRLVASVVDGSLKDAWLGLATSGVGVGAGLAFTAIDIAAISVGQGSWEQLGHDLLLTGNEMSIFAIGADWTQFDDEPGETIGRGLFGTMLLFGPKAVNNATGKLPPPAAVSTAINNATTAFGRSGLSLGAPARAVTNGISFPGAARTSGPTSFGSHTGRASSGSGVPRSPGTGPNATTPAAPKRRNSNGAPLLPAEAANAGARHSAEQLNAQPLERSDLTDSPNTANSRGSHSMDSSPITSGGSPWELHLGVSLEQLRRMAPERVSDHQVRRANVDPEYRQTFYNTLGHRKDTEARDDTGLVPPQIKEIAPGKWIAARDVPGPQPPEYRGDAILGSAANLPASTRATLNGLALDRAQSISSVPSSKTIPGYAAAQTKMTRAAERYGEGVLRHHAIPENFPGAVELELRGPGNGNHQFDGLWVIPESRLYVVGEGKSSERTGLNNRTLPSGLTVAQGDLKYFLDILRMMEGRGMKWRSEAMLADELRQALKDGRLWYGVVYGRPGIGGVHMGYKMRRFDI
ncbi:hypothetical protein ACSVDM_16745 [Nocardia sp. JW2]|uniref:hypothetical protein n=1 Tax=Nocardia sp. JW2 TaxID=3450738 RepID=UPI003F43B9D2